MGRWEGWWGSWVRLQPVPGGGAEVGDWEGPREAVVHKPGDGAEVGELEGP